MNREQIRDTIFDKITDWTPYADVLDEKIAQERTDQLLDAILTATPAQMVREFHEAFGVEIRDTPGIPLVAIAKESADLVYVILGADLAYGIDPDPVFAAVHRSNFSKLGDDGLPIYREDGKIMKGPHYVEPDIAGVLGIEAA